MRAADAKGWVELTSIFVAADSGRRPHVHVEVYPSLEDAQNASNRLRTSQMALAQDVCGQVYATDGYEASVQNPGQTSHRDRCSATAAPCRWPR